MSTAPAADEKPALPLLVDSRAAVSSPPSHPTTLGDVWIGMTQTSLAPLSPSDQTRDRQNF